MSAIEILINAENSWITLYITRDRKKLQMQLNFEKRNLKSWNGSLRFIRKGSKWQIFLCNFVLMLQFNAILCLCCNSMQFCNYNCNSSQNKRFWANILCNSMQFCTYVAIQCNFAIITAIFLKKKGFGLIFYAIQCNFVLMLQLNAILQL